MLASSHQTPRHQNEDQSYLSYLSLFQDLFYRHTKQAAYHSQEKALTGELRLGGRSESPWAGASPASRSKIFCLILAFMACDCMVEDLSPPVGTVNDVNEIQLWENWQFPWLTVKLSKHSEDSIKERIPGGRGRETAVYACNLYPWTEIGFGTQWGEERMNQIS